MKIAVISSHTPSLFWFRMDMMKDFISLGHSVIALGPESEEEWSDKFKVYNIEYKSYFVERNGVNPINDIKTYFDLDKFMKLEKPDKIFTYQAKSIIYGNLAASKNGIKDIYTLIGGLGSIFRGEGFKNYILKSVIKIQYKLACKFSKVVLFQNNDDKNEFISNKIVKNKKTAIINGSGVNLDEFKPEPMPESPVFLFVGRLIRDKGVIEYLEACRKIKEKYPSIKCLLVGPFDSNPSALKMDDLQFYIDNNIVEYFGAQSDVRPYLKKCTTFVLPSYHEGTPKTVLEAMATGRAIITSNAPGCRETVDNNYNGFLVEVKNIEELVKKMIELIENKELNELMGNRNLSLVRKKYDVRLVNQNIIEIMELEKEGVCISGEAV